MDNPHENLGAMPSTQDQFQAVGLDFDQLGMFSDLISGQSNSAVDFQNQIDSGMASPSSSISGGVPLSAEVEDNAAIPPGPAEAGGEPEATMPSKIGSRFTSGAIKVLRTWFERHEKHPYPTPKDVDRLQNQTGLERLQITNWFANTRRRKKFRPQGTSAAQVPSWTETTTGPIEIPTRRPTPMPFEMMNPMQRWEHSPPEHEPALASDINRAVAASTGQSSFPSRARSPGRSSENASSLSSAATSRSSRGSNTSAYSHGSRRSAGSQDSNKFSGRRRRRALTKMQKGERIKLVLARNTYQCTFCTETFKTKYDWQRHEKSLHLSLEEWVCSPHGSTENHPEKGEVCAYCEEPSPSKPHLDEHHQSACSEKPVEDRTFYRKDHLRQHLKLVHGSNQMTRLMDKWKVVKNNIRSACGFCGAKLETWAERGDHLADHFKNGSTMTDWQGDWGFEPAVMEMLDNAMPPYLIRFESFSALPFTASVGPADTAPSAYELLKLEIEYYIRNYFEGKDSSPSDDELKYEGCSIIFGAEFFSSALGSSPPSWLRDIFMSSTEIATKARFRPMQQLAKLRLSQLRINGKMNIFEECQLESELRHYIGMHVTLGLALSDHEIQREACAILARVEESSTNPSRRFAGFLVRLIWESKDWIAPLRQRGKQHSQDGLSTQSAPGLHADWNDPALDMAQRNLSEFSNYQGVGKMAPAADSSWFSQTASMDGLQDPVGMGLESTAESTQDFYMRLQAAKTIFKGSGQSLQGSWQGNERPGGSGMPFFLNDNNRYRRLAKELSRFVASTMSPNNPNSHIPTDEEIRHQARWVLYDDDDPWNQTPADVEEWLLKFKKDVGLA
ncbi:unnamed protein product [Colletotrichum noveboracense]|uniref:Homeobox and C2H2 transcription factor n=1 Tax=Colletotrichum noveboracense TaxID=2664923 RepID=A0A9W4WH94_9PEZI|nr:unnamed protein product [Colletotrichum noveboracense]